MDSGIKTRLAEAADVPELADLFRQCVLTHGPAHYSPAQVKAWASSADAPTFREFILKPTTYVAEDDTGILGFAGIAEDGHVTATYVRHDCLRRGIGSTLMQVVIDHGKRCGILRLYAEASRFSLGLFEKFGFRLYDTEIVDRNGVQFERYLVERLSDRGDSCD